MSESSDDSSGVLVEANMKEEEANDDGVGIETALEKNLAGEAVQIVSIGTEADRYAFHYDDDKLQRILSSVPANAKVSIVSVVGAFRTGKSFLLSWFIRYLNAVSSAPQGKDTVGEDWYKKLEELGHDECFDWRSGSERNTTGIWIWSKPFLVNDMVVLLVDTQGMFDHETTMALTASIFGFSTLLSSYQIYNVDKRIQEDNLQQLALFSEYARMAMTMDTNNNDDKSAVNNEPSLVDENVEPNKTSTEPTASSKTKATAPFQHMEFLVRDWQHFDDDEDEENYEAMERSMETYLAKVIAERDAKDLQETREQILHCFDTLSCYAMCHPGRAVTKAKYTGSTKDMDEVFLQLLVRYCRRVFDNVEPKRIHGQDLTVQQLGVYIQAYADLFVSGAQFPEAGTMLDATAKANNTNAVTTALDTFRATMDSLAGPTCSDYVRPDELRLQMQQLQMESIRVFDTMANFGNTTAITTARNELLAQVTRSTEIYESLNESRNPLAGFEIYLLPVIVALISYTIRWFTDATCSATMCRAASEVLSHIYIVVFLFLAIVASTKYKQISDALKRLFKAIDAMTSGGNDHSSKNKMKKD